MPAELHCPLCAGGKISLYSKDGSRSYFCCGSCSLVFVPPALAHRLCEVRFSVALYDSIFAPDEDVLDVSYDVMCATEVVEHLHQPGPELERLWALLHSARLAIIGADVILLQRGL